MSTTLPGASKKPYSIYSPANSKNWYVSFSIKGVGQKRIALRTSDKEQALILAEAVWERETWNDKSESAPKAKTVNQLVEQYIREEKVAPSERTTLTRYVSEYWRFFTPDMITTKMIIGFVKWRKTYWTENAGKTDEYVEYQRGDRTVRRRVSHDIPSDATLKTERSTLRKFLKYCLKERYIAVLPAFPSAPKIDKKKAVAFTDKDISTLFEFLRSEWDQKPVNASQSLDVKYRYSQLMTFLYFDVLRTSGITPRECNNLKWDDLIGYDFEPSPDEINIPQNVKLRIRTKRKTREVIPLNGFGQMLILLKSLQKRRKLATTGHYIWRDRTGKHITNLGEKVMATIKKCRLDIDAKGNPRNLESIRIHYIMSVINAVGSVDMVAENVGLTLSALEKLTGIEYRRLARSRERLRISPSDNLIPYVRNMELIPDSQQPSDP